MGRDVNDFYCVQKECFVSLFMRSCYDNPQQENKIIYELSEVKGKKITDHVGHKFLLIMVCKLHQKYEVIAVLRLTPTCCFTHLKEYLSSNTKVSM